MSQSSQALAIPLKLARTRVPLPILAAIIAVSMVLVVLIFSLLAYQIYFLNRIHWGVYVDGVDAGTMTQVEAEHLALSQSDALLKRVITINSNEGHWTTTAAELGATIDVHRSANLAYAAGRQGHFFTDLDTQLHLLETPFNVVPVIEFDTGPTNSMLYKIAQAINRAPQNAQLTLNDDLSLSVIPAEQGQTIDIEATREDIRRVVVQRGQTTIELQIDYIAPTITEVAPTQQNVAALLSQPFRFEFAGQVWTLEPQTLADMISFGSEIDEGGTGRVIALIDEAVLTTYFANIAPQVNQAPVDAWFELDTSTWALYPISPSQNKHTLDVVAAVALVTQQLDQPGSHDLTLPVIVEPPAVPTENPAQLGIRELVSTSTSYFKGSSQERMQNIAVSASKFHGLVIPPGGLFSFNEHLGDVSTANGFVESLIIRGDRTAVGIGGGVCQVSTTVFRTAFYGGFEIVERWAHGYRVGWYETASAPGLDATIYSPSVDFKFRNDTGSYLLIQTYTDLVNGTLSFNFYGTSPNRTVIVSDPVESNKIPHGAPVYEEDPSLKPGEIKQIDWANDGIDVTVSRTVYEGDALIHQDNIFSRYRPWQAIYKVGPAAE